MWLSKGKSAKNPAVFFLFCYVTAYSHVFIQHVSSQNNSNTIELTAHNSYYYVYTYSIVYTEKWKKHGMGGWAGGRKPVLGEYLWHFKKQFTKLEMLYVDFFGAMCNI